MVDKGDERMSDNRTTYGSVATMNVRSLLPSASLSSAYSSTEDEIMLADELSTDDEDMSTASSVSRTLTLASATASHQENCCASMFSEYEIFDEEERIGSKRQLRHRARRKITSQRRRRAGQVRSAFDMPGLLRSCDNFQVECLGFSEDPFECVGFRRRDLWQCFGEERPDNVVVAVEATAICSMDVDMRRGSCSRLNEEDKFPFVLGSNFVGVVHHCGPYPEEMGFKPGMRVASVVQRGSNSKYVSIPASELTIVPKQLDAAEVAALISTYLSAFQALHHGRPPVLRYSKTSLEGKRVLVTGGARLEVQAVLRLARWAGASELYVTAPRSHFKALEKLGDDVCVLDEHPDDWLPVVDGLMDVVVDYEFPRHFWEIKSALASKGRLVCVARRRGAEEDGWLAGLESFLECYHLSLVKRASLFDFVESYVNDRYQAREDMDFLLNLLLTRQIRPPVDRYIKLADIPQAHKDMQTLPQEGAIVCEPWKE